VAVIIASILEMLIGLSSIGACIRYADSMDNLRYRLQIYQLAEKVQLAQGLKAQIKR
jgi:hypothetical protein